MAMGDQHGISGISACNDTSTLIAHTIPEAVMAIFNLIFSVILQGIITTVGIITNFFNIAIFYKLGIKDSMSIGLFILSISDFTGMLLQLGISLAYVVDLIYPESLIDPLSLLWILSWPQNFVYRNSYWILTIVSIERCVCVVWPFRVKELFTRRRCAIAISVVFIIHLGLHVFVYIPQRTEWRGLMYWQGNVSKVTRKELRIIYNEETTKMEFITDISVNVVLGLASQVIIFVCTVWMIVALKSSSEIRRTENSQTLRSISSSVSLYESSGSQLSNREKRLVKMVLFLAILLTVCDLPRLTGIILLYAVPGMSTGVHPDYFTVIWVVGFTISSVGSSTNFFVYITLNASYRNMLRRWCRCACD